MKQKVRVWIEGKGIIPTVLRALSLWDYSTEEQARRQLEKVIERGNHPPGPYILQYAINRRKQEIQWPFLYIPLFTYLLISILLIMGGLSSQKPWQLFMSMAIVACLVFIFRNTWLSTYAAAFRSICLAGDALSREWFEKTKTEMENAPQNPETEIQQGQPEIPRSDETQLGRDSDATRELVKGALPIFLLHELLKKECKRPNIYDGDIHETTRYYAIVSGFKQKNILSKVKHYISRQSLDLRTPNARSTHRKYIDILQQHYNEINDDTLYKQAGDLQSFIENRSCQKDQ